MTATILLQARTNSSRLPGKVLLPVEGIPLVVLAALRAANTGHDVKVVTSCEKSDDALCDVLRRWNISFFRGDLENTLKRFVDALEGLPDERVVIRLTGDNVFPDGNLIDELLKDFQRRELGYLALGGLTSGYPYGVSAEVTLAGHLRDANNHANTSFDREHVTPGIISKFGREVFESSVKLSMSQYRCTVDTLDDYLRICRVFKGVDQPETIALSYLLDRLKAVSPEIITTKSESKLVLGTAQLGLPYGITNKTGKPDQVETNDLVHYAIANGVQYIDTARAYGSSEQALGKSLSGGWGSRVNIVTKLSPMDDCPEESSPNIVHAYIDRSILQSCHALGVKNLDVLMLHRAEHLNAWKGAVWDRLLEFKQQRVIKQLGVSVQSPEEALLALSYPDVEFIQLPYNILDLRWDGVAKKIHQVKNSRPLIVHARSILLQGLLVSSRTDLWSRANCFNSRDVIRWLEAKAETFTNGDIVELCLRYVITQDWIDGVVIGVETLEQLKDNLLKAEGVHWGHDELQSILTDRPSLGIATLNPANWKPSND